MKIFKVYTAGKMSGLSFSEQFDWRREIDRLIKDRCEDLSIPTCSVRFIHPPLYYQYDKCWHQSEKEVKNWELHQVRDSDIVVVNLDGIESSVGTHFELATVDAVNSFGHKHIFVIGVGNPNQELHPWIELCLHRRESNFEDAAEYIANYLLV